MNRHRCTAASVLNGKYQTEQSHRSELIGSHCPEPSFMRFLLDASRSQMGNSGCLQTDAAFVTWLLKRRIPPRLHQPMSGKGVSCSVSDCCGRIGQMSWL